MATYNVRERHARVIKRIQETEMVIRPRETDIITQAIEIGLRELAEKAGLEKEPSDEEK